MAGASAARNAARDALATAFAELPGATRRRATIRYSPPLPPSAADATCTAPVDLTIPVGSVRPRRLDVRVRLQLAGSATQPAVSAQSVLGLVCDSP
jgi:hypothetical protein